MPIPADEFPTGFVEWLQPLFDSRQRFVAGLGAAERWVCRRIVDSFVERGCGPTRAELTTGAFPEAELDAALDPRDARDMLVLEGGRVLALYPFSDRPCAHRVRVGGKRLYAM